VSRTSNEVWRTTMSGAMMALIDMAPEGRSGSLRELRREVRLA
jgi:hypothetical protein